MIIKTPDIAWLLKLTMLPAKLIQYYVHSTSGINNCNLISICTAIQYCSYKL
jgi:hypothetical protein